MPKTVRFGVQSQKSGLSKRTRQKVKKSTGGAKKPNIKKPEWDSTTRDLNIHKLSQPELDRRRKVHKSKNIEAAKHELYEKAKESFDLNSSGNLRPSFLPASDRTSRVKKLIALQKSLHGRQSLHDVLAESDHTMQVVQDLFGDDPKRYSCHPNVTVAPHIKDNKRFLQQTIMESLHDGPNPTAGMSPGGIRDKSVQEIVPRKPALNDLPNTSTALGYEGDESSIMPNCTPKSKHSRVRDLSTIDATTNTTSEEAPYKPALDLGRFQKLVNQESKTSVLNSKQLSPTAPPLRNPHKGDSPHRKRKEKGLVGHGRNGTAVMKKQNPKEIRQPEFQGGSTHRDKVQNNRIKEEVRRVGDGGGDMNVERESKESLYEEDQDYSDGGESMAGMSEISNIPMDPEMMSVGRGQHGDITVDSLASGIYNPPKPVIPVSSSATSSHHQYNQQGAVSKHPLHVSHKVSGQQGVGHPMGSNKVSGDFKEIRTTPQSVRTERIHTELNTLEQLVQDLDHELKSYEKSIASPQCSTSDMNHCSTATKPPPLLPNGNHPLCNLDADRGSSSMNKVMGSLLGSVKRVVQYLEQSELQLKGEVAVRGQFIQTLDEQQNLMDALAADLISIQKENAALKHDLTEVMKYNTEEMAKIKGEVAGLRLALTVLAQPSTAMPTSVVPSQLFSNSKAVGPNLSIDSSFSSVLNHPPTKASQGRAVAKASFQQTTNEEVNPVISRNAQIDVTKSISADNLGPVAYTNEWVSPAIAAKCDDKPVMYAQVSPLTFNNPNESEIPYPQSTHFDPQIQGLAAPRPPPSQGSAFYHATESHSSSVSDTTTAQVHLIAPAPPPLSEVLKIPTYRSLIQSQPSTCIPNSNDSLPNYKPTGPPSVHSAVNCVSEFQNSASRVPVYRSSIQSQPSTYISDSNDDLPYNKPLRPPPMPSTTSISGLHPSPGPVILSPSSSNPNKEMSVSHGGTLDSTTDSNFHMQHMEQKSKTPPCSAAIFDDSVTAPKSTQADPKKVHFNMTGLFESLQKLNKTQGELQATADKLRSHQPPVSFQSSISKLTPTEPETSYSKKNSGNDEGLNLGGLKLEDEHSLETEISLLSLHLSTPEKTALKDLEERVSSPDEHVMGELSSLHLKEPLIQQSGAKTAAAMPSAEDALRKSKSSPAIIMPNTSTESTSLSTKDAGSAILEHQPSSAVFDKLMHRAVTTSGVEGKKDEKTWFALSSHLA